MLVCGGAFWLKICPHTSAMMNFGPILFILRAGCHVSKPIGRTAVRDGLRHYGLPDEIWGAFNGNPGEDLKLVAVLPPKLVAAALERAQLHDGATF